MFKFKCKFSCLEIAFVSASILKKSMSILSLILFLTSNKTGHEYQAIVGFFFKVKLIWKSHIGGLWLCNPILFFLLTTPIPLM